MYFKLLPSTQTAAGSVHIKIVTIVVNPGGLRDGQRAG